LGCDEAHVSCSFSGGTSCTSAGCEAAAIDSNGDFVPISSLSSPPNAGVDPVDQFRASLSSEVGGPPSSQDALVYVDPNGDQFTNPTGGDMRGCDAQGCGYPGASRNRSGIKGIHLGIDFTSTPGQDVVASFDGRAYPNNSAKYPGVYMAGKKYTASTLYVRASGSVSNAGAMGLTVNAGDVIGTALDITGRYPGITNHVHFQLKTIGSPLFIDPNPFFPSRR